MIVNHMICSSTVRLKCRSQVTDQVRGYRSRVTGQVTGHRSQDTQKTKGHYTKNKISQGTLMIFLSFKQLNSTRGIRFSCWSYIQTTYRNHKGVQNHVICAKNKSHVFHWKRSVVVVLECHLKINCAAKITWSESLKCSTVITSMALIHSSIQC